MHWLQIAAWSGVFRKMCSRWPGILQRRCAVGVYDVLCAAHIFIKRSPHHWCDYNSATEKVVASASQSQLCRSHEIRRGRRLGSAAHTLQYVHVYRMCVDTNQTSANSRTMGKTNRIIIFRFSTMCLDAAMCVRIVASKPTKSGYYHRGWRFTAWAFFRRGCWYAVALSLTTNRVNDTRAYMNKYQFVW